MKCERCNKEHDGSFGSGRFCDRACANTRQHSKETKEKISNTLQPEKQYVERQKYDFCLCCGGMIGKKAKRFCSKECQLDYQYLIYINKWKLGLVDGTKGDYQISNHVRRYLFEKNDNKCQKCGWGVVHPITGKVPLTSHHIDGNCINNKEGNFELLCPNCHSLTDNFGSLNTDNIVGRNERLGIAV